MAKPNNTLRALIITAVAAFTGFALGACREDVAVEDVPLDVQTSCNDYCTRVVFCNPDRDEQDCRQSCYNAMNACMVGELGNALDRLDECARGTCDDVLACTIDVGATCYFGL
jgi:hypothetical protein